MRAAVLLTVAGAALGLVALPGAANAAVLARQDPTVLAGGGGRIAWSRWDAKARRYRLVVTVGWRTSRLPVAPRPLPFDVSIGTTWSGALVAVYSRCADAPVRGCKLFAWSFRDRRERRMRVTPPAGATSLLRPAISRGQLAFVARQRNGQFGLYLARGEGAAPRQVRLPRPGGDNPYAGVRTGDAEGLTSIALRDGVLAYTWSYAGQRPTCGETDFKVGPGTDTMLVVRQRSGRQELLTHTGCDADGPAFAVYGAQWSSDGALRWLTVVENPDRSSTTELRLTPAGRGASQLWSTPGNLVSYAQDDRGHAVGQIGRKLMTMPVLP